MGRLASSGTIGRAWSGTPSAPSGYQTGHRDAEVALPADQPVAVQPVDPVLVAHLHVRRVPPQLFPAGEQRLAQVGVPPAVADVPLPAGHDLEGAIAAFVELDRMGDGPGLADQVARLGEQLDHGALRRLDGAAGDGPPGRAVGARPGGGASVIRPARVTMERVGRCSSRHQITSVTSPKVQIMAIPDPFSGSARRMGERSGTSTPKSGVCTVVPNAVGEPLVVGVGHEGHAGGQQLGPRRVDLDVVEAEAVVRPGLILVLHLGLGHRGLVVDVPQRRRLGRVRLAPGQVAQEHALAGPAAALVDGGVAAGPVHREAEPAPERPRRPSRPARSAGVHRAMKLGRLTGMSSFPGSAGGFEVGVVGQGRDRSGRRSRSGPGARWGARCRPTPSGRRAPTRSSAGSGPAHRSARSRRPSPCAASRKPSAAGCRWRRPARGSARGRSDRCPRPPRRRPTCASIPSRVGLSGTLGARCRVGRHDRVTVPGCCTSTTPQPAPSALSSCGRRAKCRCTSVGRPSTTCPTSATAASP